MDQADSTIAPVYPREARTATSRSSQEPPALRPEAGVAMPPSSPVPPSLRPEVEAAIAAMEGTLHQPKELTFTDNAD